MSRTYSDEYRKMILAEYMEQGARPTARKHGLPLSTLRSWAAAAGLHTRAASSERTARANAVLRARRAEVRVELLSDALRLLRRLREPYVQTMMVDGKIGKVTLDEPPARESQALATAAAILFDKLRLEEGKPTEVSQTITMSQLDAEIARLEAELAQAHSD